MASLLGTTYGLPAVAFESPGERLASTRLGIPLPPEIASTGNYSLAPVTHVYHTADPIPQGVCTGRASPCAQAGYALETRCHLGMSIVYDTVGRLKWSVDIRTHPIKEIINRVLEKEIWWEFGRQVPKARAEEDCVVSHSMRITGRILMRLPWPTGVSSLGVRRLFPPTRGSSNREHDHRCTG